jgi:hypothetical protein
MPGKQLQEMLCLLCNVVSITYHRTYVLVKGPAQSRSLLGVERGLATPNNSGDAEENKHQHKWRAANPTQMVSPSALYTIWAAGFGEYGPLY